MLYLVYRKFIVLAINGIYAKSIHGHIGCIFIIIIRIQTCTEGNAQRQEASDYRQKFYSHYKAIFYLCYLQAAKIGTFFTIISLKGKFYINL
jgi:hypothetical protein